jgi:glycosyltransferase involved in cell wall biosynthesis
VDRALRAQVKLLLVGDKIHPDPDWREGVKSFATLLAAELASRGHRCELLSTGSAASLPIRRWRERGVGVTLIRRRAGPFDIEKWTLRCLALRGRPDALLAIGTAPRPLAARLARRVAVWIYRWNGIEELEPPPEALLTAEHRRLADALSRAHPRHSVVELPPCVDLKAFAPRTVRRGSEILRAFFASSPLPKHEPAAVEDRYLARRGVLALLDLLRELGPGGPLEAELLWRKDPTHVQSLARDLGDLARVRAEPVSDMNTYLERFDLCAALFSDGPDAKAIPQSCLEALAKGIPLLVRRDTALADLVEKSGAGVAIALERPSETRETLERIRSQPAAWDELSKAARRLAELRFAPGVVVDQLLDALSGVTPA